MLSKDNHPHDRSKVQSVERCLDILESLAVAENSIGILDLSNRVALHPSTVHRLLSTLLARGYVRQDSRNGRYSLGARALALAQSFHERQDLRTDAHPFLQRLMQETGETANLIVLDCDEAVYVDQVPSPHLVRMFASIGRHVPLHSTGCGKVLLAHLESSERSRIFREKGLPRSTRYTITSATELERELADIRRRGYAVDDRENDEDVRCIAGPVRDHMGKVIAALSISGPTARVTKERIPDMGRLVVAIATELSAALGHKPPSR
jgi:IclR family KDG regulon transcriptional repressor